MTAEFFYTNQLLFREVDRRWCVTVAIGGQMIAGTVATAMIVPAPCAKTKFECSRRFLDLNFRLKSCKAKRLKVFERTVWHLMAR